MAIRSPAQDLSSSPESTGQAEGPVFGSATPGDADGGAALGLELMRAEIRDGVLMVFGPDGDPVPPQAVAAAAAAQPGAMVGWADGPAIEAERIAAVLEAQKDGRLGSKDDGDDAWIKAMLGIGPQPEMAAEDDLLAEGHEVEIVAFGKEMMISSPAGGTFLIAEARSTSPASVGLRGPDGEPVALGAVVAHLLGRVPRGGAARAKVNEVAFPDCRTWIEDDALIIEVPEVGALHFVRSDPAAPGPSVSVFMPDGETATIDELLEALSRPLTSPDDEAFPHEDAIPPAAAHSGACDPDPASPPQGPARPPRQIPVSVRMPEAFAARAEEVALVVVRGLPHGATLSAGAASGDGSWLLSPRDLAGLSLAPPPGWTLDLALEIAAIAIQDRDGRLASASKILQIPLHPSASGRGHAPVPIVIEPEALSGHTARLDAIVVRDLPAEARLSAGAYDPEIDGWVLLPRQLQGLTVTPGVEQTEDFSLTLLAITLADGRARSRFLTRIPVAIG
jgi:hypothetical protein